MNNTEKQLAKLLNIKIEIQGLEGDNNRNKETLKDLQTLVRHTSQKIGEKKRMLFDMI